MRGDTPQVRGVLFPGAFRPRSDTWLLARAGCREPLAPGALVLELCAGPAFAGIAVARSSGAHLTTVDVSRRAVVNARVNALLNGVAIRARRGDLFTAVEGERFDLILANPPYVPGPRPPRSGPARAWEAGDDGRAVLDQLCAAAPEHLRPGGVVLVVHSEVCDTQSTLRAFAAGDLAGDVVACERGPLGPLLRERRTELELRGLLRPGQQEEEVLVLRGRARDAGAATVAKGRLTPASAATTRGTPPLPPSVWLPPQSRDAVG
jgi:release factor glutamine methyltransferase